MRATPTPRRSRSCSARPGSASRRSPAAREQQGRRTAIELGDDIDLAGRPLTVAVTASGAGGVRYQRRWLIELTGSDARPYVIRSVG